MKKFKHQKYLFGAIVISLLLGVILTSKIWIGSSAEKQAKPAKIQASEGKSTRNRVAVVFDGERPAWSNEAIAVMADLEKWRGKEFTRDLQVNFRKQDNPGLAGWYSFQNKTLVVTTESSNRFGRGVMLHEIFHALQDQNFNLMNLFTQTQTSDAERALEALVEGEAMLAVSELMNYDFESHARLPLQGAVGEELFEMLFKYKAGMRFVRAVRNAGGWEAVDSAFKNPPQSTSQIYNPEQYIAGKEEIAIKPRLEPGEELQSQQIRGEYQVRLWLARNPQSRMLEEEAGTAYQTDTLAIAKDKNGKSIHRWIIEFDNSAIAQKLSFVAPAAIASMPEASLNPKWTFENQTAIVEW